MPSSGFQSRVRWALALLLDTEIFGFLFPWGAGSILEVAGSHGLLLQDICVPLLELRLVVRNSKTDQLGRGEVVRLPATGEVGSCPVKDVRKYLALRPPGDGPLLMLENDHPLAQHYFTKVMRKAISACGISASGFAPHSFHIGAATMVAHWGFSAARIKDLGHGNLMLSRVMCETNAEFGTNACLFQPL